MKKVILLFTIAGTILFTSCSKDDDNSSTPDVLLKRTVQTDEEGVLTSDASYDGNKLISVLGVRGSERLELRHTYTGDLITKRELLTNSVLTLTDIYEYNANNQLIVKKTTTIFNPAIVFRSEYVHNSNNTISVRNLIGDATSQTELVSTGTITFTNGEVSRIEEVSIGSPDKFYTYTYDTKNHPGKNVTGINKIAFASEDDPSIARNLVEMVEGEVGSPSDNITTTIQYTYNSNDYPATSTETVSDGDIPTTSRTVYSY
ncbi:MAG TPA: hypothetical protein VF677_12285 [Flavobacterium sp.]|jgi:hypothetical protein